jgi:hypothetical protein
MANTDIANGFRPVMHLNGSPYNGQFRKYYSPNDNLFLGDLVEQETTGVRSGDGAYPTVDRIDAAGDRIVGVVVGWEANKDALSNKYHAASSTYAVYIADARDLIMECQSDDATMVLGDIGLNASPTVTAGTIATGRSNMELDGSSAAATNTLTLRIVGFVDRTGNDSADSTANTKVLVTVNSSAWGNLTVGV